MTLPLIAPRPRAGAQRSRAAARMLWRTGSVAAAAAAAGAGAAGWLTSRALTTTPTSPARWPVIVTAVAEDRVRLAGPGAALSGTWGLWWPDGYARMLAPGAGDARTGFRDLAWMEGYLRPGMRAGMCAYAWPDRPQALGVPWTEVHVGARARSGADGGPDGPRTRVAWRFGAGDNADWVIFVHGRGGLRAQSFRALHSSVAAGWTGLAITYRGAIEDGGGRNGLGAREWADLEDAVQHALDAGARRVVLAGFSMGGAIVAELLHRSPLASAVSGVVLDAPVLDWGRVLAHHAKRMRLPRVLVPLALSATHLRAGRDPRLLDQLRRTVDWSAPVLLVHGTEDTVVPVTSSDLLAEARPDIVSYLRVAGAGHVTAWNADPFGYERALVGFLAGLG